MRSTGIAVALVVLAALLGSGPAAAATVSLSPLRTVPMGYTSTTNYTVASDGTIWLVRQLSQNEDKIWQLDDEGNVLHEYPITSGVFYPLSIGYYGGRVYVARAGGTYDGLISWPVGGIGTTTPVLSDAETDERIGTLGFYFRIGSNGVATAAMGQGNKVATLDLGNVSGQHPFYGQEFYGAGITQPYDEHGNSFESCVYPASGPEGGTGGGPPARCGTNNGVSPRQNGSPGFEYPDDVAPGNDGLYILELEADRVTFLDSAAGSLDYSFSGPGSGAGQMLEPYSIVRQASTEDIFVSDQGNRRIDVFHSGGAYIASFGYGVADGADSFEACGVEIGPCQAGVGYGSDPHSYFSRLDLGPEGNLYAYEPLANQIQVFSLGELAGSGGGTGGGGAPSGGSPAPGNPGSGSTGAGAPGSSGNPAGEVTKTKPPQCRKGFVAKTVAHQTRCVKRRHHKQHKKDHHHKHHGP